MCVADSSKIGQKLYHYSGFALAMLTPIAIFMSPSGFNVPIDFALALIFPFHSHVALNYVVSDYVPKPARQPARIALLITTVVTVIGLLKVNIQGPGITETLLSLWRPVTKKEEKK